MFHSILKYLLQLFSLINIQFDPILKYLCYYLFYGIVIFHHYFSNLLSNSWDYFSLFFCRVAANVERLIMLNTVSHNAFWLTGPFYCRIMNYWEVISTSRFNIFSFLTNLIDSLKMWSSLKFDILNRWSLKVISFSDR